MCQLIYMYLEILSIGVLKFPNIYLSKNFPFYITLTRKYKSRTIVNFTIL